MKRLIFASCVGVLILGLSPNAHADTYSVTFSGTGDVTAGNVTFPSPTLHIDINGYSALSITLNASDLPTDSYTYFFTEDCVAEINCDGSFSFSDVTNGTGGNMGWNVNTSNTSSFPGGGSGTISFTDSTSATPEPGSLALLGTGLLATVGVLRRKLLRS